MNERGVAHLLSQKKMSVAVAESCTGGLISHALTNIPGSSSYFLLGVAAYADTAKIRVLGVRAQTIKKHGAVSPETAIEMAQGIKRLASSHIGLGVTGIAGPGGATATKPVGTVFSAIAIGHHVYFKKYRFRGSRLSIKNQAKEKTLELLKTCLMEPHGLKYLSAGRQMRRRMK